MLAPGWFWPVLLAPFIGSFLGVLVVRLPQERPVLWDRSVCDHCAARLALRDLVPLVSWTVLRGRCRQCGAAIGFLPLTMELGALVVALWAATVAEGALLWASCALGWVLLTLAAIDSRDGILPDVLTLPLVLLGLVVAYFLEPWQLRDCAIGAAAGYVAFAVIRWLYERLRGREGLGLGDAKLLAAAGAWVGWDGLPSVVLVAAVLGLVAALLMAVRGRRLSGDQSLAFGPALCAGIWLVWLYGPLG